METPAWNGTDERDDHCRRNDENHGASRHGSRHGVFSASKAVLRSWVCS